MKNLLFLTITILFLSSCNSLKHSYRLAKIDDSKLISNDYYSEIDVNVDKIVKGESGKHKTVEAAKEEAYYNAITQNNIHVLVSPIYKTRTTDKILFFGGKTTVSVSGFPGTYKNVKSKRAQEEQITKELFANRSKRLNELIKSEGVQPTSSYFYSLDNLWEKDELLFFDSTERSYIDLYQEIININLLNEEETYRELETIDTNVDIATTTKVKTRTTDKAKANKEEKNKELENADALYPKKKTSVFSIFTPKVYKVIGINANPFYSRRHTVYGINVGGIYNHTDYKSIGIVTVGGLALESGGVSGGINVGGLYAKHKGKAIGINIAGLVGIYESDAIGLNIGGIYNKVKGVAKGYSFGLINHAHELQGAQYGLINIAEKNGLLPVMPFFNVGFVKKKKKTDN